MRKLKTLFWLYVAFDLFVGGYCGGFLPLSRMAAAQQTIIFPSVYAGATSGNVVWTAGTVNNGGHAVSVAASNTTGLATTASKGDCSSPNYGNCNFVYANSSGTVAVTTTLATAAAQGNTLLAYVETSGGAPITNIAYPLQSNTTSTQVLLQQALTPAQMAAGVTKVTLTSPFTDSNSTSLQLITGLSFTFPTTFSGNVAFHCSLQYSQATEVADGLGVGVTTTAPTRLDAWSLEATNATAFHQGVGVSNVTSTTPTATDAFTPAVTTGLVATIDGQAQLAGGGSQVLGFYVSQTTGADVIVIAAGSYCTIQ